MLNPYTNFNGSKNEQELAQDLTDEVIQMAGVDVQYARRDMIDKDAVLGESVTSSFKDWIRIEVMPEDMQGFNGDGDLFGKFGIELNDSCTLLVSKRRFQEEAKGLGLEIPREGDIIMDTMTSSLWEVKRLKQDREYFKLGKNYVWRLECELFVYGHEEIFQAPETEGIREKTHAEAGVGGMGATLGLGIPLADESLELELASPVVQKVNIPSGGTVYDPFGEGA